MNKYLTPEERRDHGVHPWLFDAIKPGGETMFGRPNIAKVRDPVCVLVFQTFANSFGAAGPCEGSTTVAICLTGCLISLQVDRRNHQRR